MAWGIRPLVMARHDTTDEIVWHAVEAVTRLGLVRAGEVVGVLVGSPQEAEPTTDVLRLVRIR
jgi:pyruvate kinase